MIFELIIIYMCHGVINRLLNAHYFRFPNLYSSHYLLDFWNPFPISSIVFADEAITSRAISRWFRNIKFITILIISIFSDDYRLITYFPSSCPEYSAHVFNVIAGIKPHIVVSYDSDHVYAYTSWNNSIKSYTAN